MSKAGTEIMECTYDSGEKQQTKNWITNPIQEDLWVAVKEMGKKLDFGSHDAQHEGQKNE